MALTRSTGCIWATSMQQAAGWISTMGKEGRDSLLWGLNQSKQLHKTIVLQINIIDRILQRLRSGAAGNFVIRVRGCATRVCAMHSAHTHMYGIPPAGFMIGFLDSRYIIHRLALARARLRSHGGLNHG